MNHSESWILNNHLYLGDTETLYFHSTCKKLMDSYDQSDINNDSYSDIIVTWIEDLNSNRQVLIKAQKHFLFKEDFYARKKHYLSSIVLRHLHCGHCNYLQDEDKYLKVFYQWLLKDMGKQQEWRYLGFLLGQVIKYFLFFFNMKDLHF